MIGGLVIVFVMTRAPAADRAEVPPPALYAALAAVSGLFFGLYWWSRKNPFPAAIAALVIYVSIWMLDVIADPSMICQGALIKVIVIIVLIRAVSAGVKYRRLLRQQPAA